MDDFVYNQYLHLLKLFTLKMCSSRKNPYSPHGRSLKIRRWKGILKATISEAKYEAKQEFLGGGGGCKTITFCGGGIDIFWNCTFETIINTLVFAW